MVGFCGTETIPQESVATVTEKEAALGASTKNFPVQRELFSSLPCRVIRSWIQSLQSHPKSGWPVWKWKEQSWLVPLEMRDGRGRAQTPVHMGSFYHFKATFWTVNFFFYWLPLSSWPCLIDSKWLGWFSSRLCFWNYTVRLYPQNLHGTKLIATLSWQRSSLPSCVLGRFNLHVLDCHIRVALRIGQTQPRNKSGRQHVKGCLFFQTWNYLGDHNGAYQNLSGPSLPILIKWRDNSECLLPPCRIEFVCMK